MRTTAAILSIILATALGGCHETQIMCPAIFILQNGVSVHVKDSVTGAFAASGAKIVARSSTYGDSSALEAGHPESDSQTLGAAHRPEIYTVTVSKAGYQDWVRANVSVTAADKCELRNTELTALLQP